MRGNRNNEQLESSNGIFSLSALTVLGNRSEQQDSFGFEMGEEECLAVICDGMGGMENGREASSSTVDLMLRQYRESGSCRAPVDFMISCAREADRTVSAMQEQAGSTLVTVMLRDNSLYWVSVGDSRGYLLRDGAFVQFTVDQNYRTVLEEQLCMGLITRQEFEDRSADAEALVSYIGIGELELIDHCSSPVRLRKGDRIVLMSDGLYKLVKEERIFRIVRNFSNIGEALQMLETTAQKNARQNGLSRDNMTVMIIEVLQVEG